MIICGARDWKDPDPIERELLRFDPSSLVIVGGAPGADTFGEWFAHHHGYRMHVERAHWKHDAHCAEGCKRPIGKPAGPIRNQVMLDKLLETAPPGMPLLHPNSDLYIVLAFHPYIASSSGTRDMATRANMAGVAVECYAR